MVAPELKTVVLVVGCAFLDGHIWALFEPKATLETNELRKSATEHRPRTPRGYWAIVIISFGFMGGIALLLGTFSFSELVGSTDLTTQSVSQSPGDQTHTGKIILHMAAGECRQMRFDNSSGRFDADLACDEKIILDKHGVPIPLGTQHRIDAISKSFSSH